MAGRFRLNTSPTILEWHSAARVRTVAREEWGCDMPAVPRVMRAAAIERFGGPEVLEIHALPVPEIDTREVLIALHTAGVGGWDAEMRGGWWPLGRPRFPLVLGTDGSGTIAKVGSRVRGFKPGERVYSSSFPNPKGGYYAEY